MRLFAASVISDSSQGPSQMSHMIYSTGRRRGEFNSKAKDEVIVECPTCTQHRRGYRNTGHCPGVSKAPMWVKTDT